MTWTIREHVRHPVLDGTGDRKVADAKSLIVRYDYASGTSIPLSDHPKRRLKSE